MTSPFAPFSWTISVHIDANYQLMAAPQFLHYCTFRFASNCGVEHFGTKKWPTKKSSYFYRKLTPKIQCNVQISEIRLNEIINNDRFFFITYRKGNEAIVFVQFCIRCEYVLFCYEGSFAFWPTAVRPVTNYWLMIYTNSVVSMNERNKISPL